VQGYLETAKQLSITARFGIALRLFERYVRIRGLEDESVWIFLDHMWAFPLTEDWNEWEKQRGDLADFGLGDELPEELEEELWTLGVDEDYFESWVASVVETLWPSLLKGVPDEESLGYLEKVLTLAEANGLEWPALDLFQCSKYADDGGWGARLTRGQRDSWREA